MSRAAIRFVAAGFGSGWAPVAPGTFGTLAGLPLCYALSFLSPTMQLLLLVAAIPAAAWVCHHAALEGPSKDPGWIVLDEIIGIWAATLWLEPTIASYTAAFFLFRLFDILKPPPVGTLDRKLDGGWGILLDDVAAGAMARLCLVGLAALGAF